MITLSNGVVLAGRKMQEGKDGGSSISKAIARQIFAGDLKMVTATCTTCSTPHTNEFEVIRREDGCIEIGCKTFTKDDIKLVKKWLKR